MTKAIGLGVVLGAGGHALSASPALESVAGDAQVVRVSSSVRGPERRLLLARELSAQLVAQSLHAAAGADVSRSLGFRSRQGVQHWTDPTRPGPAFSYVLAGPRTWTSCMLLGALARLDVLTPRSPYSPQQLVALVVSAAMQVATILDRRDLDKCSVDELEEMERAVGDQQERLAELRDRLAAAKAAKRPKGSQGELP